MIQYKMVLWLIKNGKNVIMSNIVKAECAFISS